jgi:hypothetical protein
MTLGVLAVAGLCACGSTTAGPVATSGSPSASPLSCTSSGVASADWPAPDSSPKLPEIVSASVSGDTLTITFAKGTPAFDVVPQPTAHFTKDPSGMSVDLAGSAGAVIHLRGFLSDANNFSGAVSTSSLGPMLRDVKVIGNFEGVISLAVGLGSAGCANVTSTATTLTFHFVKASV